MNVKKQDRDQMSVGQFPTGKQVHNWVPVIEDTGGKRNIQRE